MSEENTETTDTPVAPARMCKGTMPSMLVWYIKFHEEQDNRSAVAKKYFTTAGKIADIQSGSNQKYIVKSMSWSEEDCNTAAETISANFVRGQAEKEAGEEVTSRKLATTKPGDEEYSQEVIGIIAAMDFDSEAIDIVVARSIYNDANPRVKKEKVEDTAVEQADESEDDVDDLME